MQDFASNPGVFKRFRCPAMVQWVLSTLLLCTLAQTQTLARPGWAGSGLSAEAWWRSAIFYRIEPSTFQDSDGDGKGDLRGIAQRMSYLQTLGVDAIVLNSVSDDTGFDDLLREASSRHVRILVTVLAAPGHDAINEARSWLTRGCAGVWLRLPAKADAIQMASLVRGMRVLTDSFPSQRVLVEDSSEDPAQLPLAGAQLIARALRSSTGRQTDALSLRVQLAQFGSLPADSFPVLVLHRDSETTDQQVTRHDAVARVLAAALFLSDGGAAIDAGQELDHRSTDAGGQLMQWTPSNRTREITPEPPPQPAPKPRREDEYGSFVPYVAPPAKKPVKDAAAAPDLNALPGFSTVAVASAPIDIQNNAASEDAEPTSLLNFYRRLAQLRHENAALHSGTTALMNADADDVLAWVRRAPSGARTSSSVLVACNLSDTVKTLSALDKQKVLPNSASATRTLLTTSPSDAQSVQLPSAVSVAPWGVVVLSFR